jgi:hypothetical protein
MMVDDSNWNWGEAPISVLKEWAMKYVELGWNLMPLMSDGKGPRLKEWEFLQKIKVAPEKVEAWWTEYPYANIGLICGQISGVIVLDIDRPEECDLPIYEICTSRSETSRGFHLIFEYPAEGFPSFKGQGFDVQSNGKYIILPPSVHPSGKIYKWSDFMDPWHEDPAPVPQWLRDRAVTGPQNGNGTIKPVFSLENYFEPIQKGGRNNAAAKLAGYLFGRDRDFEEVFCTLLGWNLRNPDPLSPREIKTVVESVYKKHQRRP